MLEPFRKLHPFRKWDKAININPEGESSYNTQYQGAFLKYVENEYFAKHRPMSVIIAKNVPRSNIFHSGKASGFGQSSVDLDDLSSSDEEYITPKRVTETTPGQSDPAARLLTAARLYFDSPPELPNTWGQVNPNLDDYHSDPMEISGTFWLWDITNWWRQQDETHSKYADLSSVAHDIFSIIPHRICVGASFSLGQDVISWTESKSTHETVREEVIARQFARANNEIFEGDFAWLDTAEPENDLELNKEAEEMKLRRVANVHHFLEMWQGSQCLCATQKESATQNKQMAAVGYTSDTEEINNASWSNF